MDRNKRLLVVDWKPERDGDPPSAEKLPKDKLVYSIDWNDLVEVPFDDPILAPLLPLVDSNVAFAAVPENFGEGCACYLLNLSSLRRS